MTDPASGAKAVRGLVLASSFYWDQNDQERLFAGRSLAAAGRMPDAAHVAAYAALRRFPRAVAAAEGLDADLINQEMRRRPVYFVDRPARPRLDGRPASNLSLFRLKPSEAMRGERDDYEQIGVIPKADIYGRPNQKGCPRGV